MLKSATVAACLMLAFLLSATVLDAGAPIRMQVSPSVARAPADLMVRISVPYDAENRSLRVVAESADFYRSSEVPLDGEGRPPLNVFEFRNLPSGLYQVTGVLVGVRGRRAMVSALAKVEPPFGR